MQHWAYAAVGIAFWLFLTVTTLAGVITEYKRRRLALEPLRAAIEHGQHLDPQLIERLLEREHVQQPLNPVYLRVGGIITLASGVGIVGVSMVLAVIVPMVRYPVLALGVLAICVGAGVWVSAGVVERARLQERTTVEPSA